MKYILSVGELMIENEHSVPHEIFPESGTVRIKNRPKSNIRVGGAGYLPLLAAHRLSNASVCWCGPLCPDEEDKGAECIASSLRAYAIDLRFANRQSGIGPPTQATMIKSESGQTFTVIQEGETMPFTLREEHVTGASLVMVDSPHRGVQSRAVFLAEKNDVPVVGTIQEWDGDKLLADYERLVDHLIVSLAVSRKRFGTAYETTQLAEKWWTTGVKRKLVCITDGPRGCWWTTDGRELHHQEAHHDRPGSNDGVFLGTYAAMLFRDATPERRIEVTSAVVDSTCLLSPLVRRIALAGDQRPRRRRGDRAARTGRRRGRALSCCRCSTRAPSPSSEPSSRPRRPRPTRCAARSGCAPRC